MEISITIPEALVSKARSNGVSPETYIERLLEKIAAASAERDRERERLRRELAADWESYRTTGLHLDGDEVETWLAELEDGHLEEPPALHV
ncbi:MAG: hypothetical protein WBE72_17525 [Terracidiphilus sp.]